MPRLLRITGPAVLLVAALLSMLAALAYGGGASAAPIVDPGAVVRLGLPIAKLALNIGAAGTIGALVLVCFALSDGSGGGEKRGAGIPDGTREFDAGMDVAAGSAAIWTVAASATALFTYLDVSLQPFSLEESFGTQFGRFLVDFPIGNAVLAAAAIPAVVTVLCFAIRNRTALFFVTVLAVAGLVPLALQGHTAGTAGHDAAVSSLGLHLVFAAIWVGGLLTMVFTRRAIGRERLAVVLARYSTLALVCFIVVAASGAVNAALRVGSFAALLTPYGILVVVKVIALCGLGVFGALQRQVMIRRLARQGSGGSGPFWLLVAMELGVMGIAFGVATALGRTRTPVPEELLITTPASLLTGEPLPPELTPVRFITEWKFDILWILVIAFLAFFYLAGVWRLHRRGDRWPVLRTTLWLLGLALLFYVTNGGVNAYEKYLFSVHMLAHMALGMIIPVLLVPAAPVTLAMRAIAKRTDGSRGPREWILLAVHSRIAGVFANPLVAAAFFAGSLWVFYYSPLFRWATVDHIGHTFMIVHFLLSGYLFVQTLIGIDPLPYRAPYPMRLLVLIATLAFHAFFGLGLMTGTGLLLADWYGAMGRPWGASALADQQAGGGIAWSIGEIPTLIIAIAVVILWARSDSREARRIDRKADRDGDADLADYNEMLADLQKRP